MTIYLQQGILPADPEEARLIRRRAHVYTLIGDQLYKRTFFRPLLKYLGTDEAEYALQEVHQGCYSNHVGGRMLARKILLPGIFGPLCREMLSDWIVTNGTRLETILTRSSGLLFQMDTGRQFQGRKIQEWCRGFGITQSFTFVAYPQSNGQTEVANREIVRGLKVKLDHVGDD
ncbi:uncharacterized protein LOC122004828 [Zingiber officinale]|uniref:uncharacterized protein LOC122004828 n=1 Tax=Zingiber officinale TaxID=94328 RepID=UPI001C4B2939|nr:uncharacterized protein LOC122004828 [Zingiber officinale]